MKKFVSVFVILFFTSVVTFGQKYYSKTGEISFFSSTPIEDIEAKSNSASTVIDLGTGNIQWAVLIKSFEFEKALMQEHFNENYMESTKFPKAKFKGKVSSIESVDLFKDGKYICEVDGLIEIHGVEKRITSPVTFVVDSGSLKANCNITIIVSDYGIEIPSVVKGNIANEIEIKIKANYEKLDKS